MAQVKEDINLAEITKREVAAYAGSTHKAALYPVLDDANQTYAVLLVPQNPNERPAYAIVMARIVGENVVIDEDTSAEKTLHDALMVNGGIPRERIILAYKGEKL